VLKRGFDVVYVSEAVSWTETPSTVNGFLKQQRRWKRGYVRESLFTLLYAWRVKKLLRAPDKLLGLFLYMFFYEGCLYWLNLWALFTVRNKSWVTRAPEPQPA
jgi:cellulose synthase/poly-beta-1,6-N-acetylglucosamine synthase-like glycosyltransferase